MPFNMPTTTPTRYSLGPAVIYMGVAGATPTTQVGSISESGGNFEVSAGKVDVRQGNPPLIEHSFVNAMDAKFSFESLEWDAPQLRYALGAGQTNSSGSNHTFTFGGVPSVVEVAIKVVHQMPAGGTVSINMWRARADGTVGIAFGQEVHRFPQAYTAMRAATNWAGQTLLANEQLFAMNIQYAS